MFGHLGKRKILIFVRLRGVQLRLADRQSNTFLENLEQELLTQYDTILEQEELFWWQNSKANCWVKGEDNTKYFYAHAKIQRRRTKVLWIKNEGGIRIDDSK